MNPFRRRPTAEALDFLDDAARLTADQIRRNADRSAAEERTAKAVDEQAATFRRRSAEARRKKAK